MTITSFPEQREKLGHGGRTLLDSIDIQIILSLLLLSLIVLAVLLPGCSGAELKLETDSSEYIPGQEVMVSITGLQGNGSSAVLEVDDPGNTTILLRGFSPASPTSDTGSIEFTLPAGAITGTYTVHASRFIVDSNQTMHSWTTFDVLKTSGEAWYTEPGFFIITILLLSFCIGFSLIGFTQIGRYQSAYYFMLLRGRPTTGSRLKDNLIRWLIIGLIHEKGEVHFGEILSELDLPVGVAVHHLSVLEKNNIIDSRREGLRKVFYLHNLDPIKKKILAALEIDPNLDCDGIASRISSQPQLVQIHLRELLTKGFLTKAGNKYGLQTGIPVIWKMPDARQDVEEEPEMEEMVRLRRRHVALRERVIGQEHLGRDVTRIVIIMEQAEGHIKKKKLEKASNTLDKLEHELEKSSK